MRKLLTIAAALACSIGLLAAPTLNAAPVVSQTRAGQSTETSYLVSTAAATDYTNSTVTPSAITDATVTVPASKRGSVSGEYIEVCFWAQGIKATSTTGSIVPTSSNSTLATALGIGTRTIASSAGASTISGCTTLARPVATSFTVSLNGVSGDTAQFTVSEAQIKVRTFFVLS